jgi:hypothetical protein
MSRRQSEAQAAYDERFENRRFVIGLRLAGYMPFSIAATTGLSVYRVNKILQSHGRVHRKKPRRGCWQPYDGIREHYSLPAFLPRVSHRMFGLIRPVCEITPREIIDDCVERFCSEHFEWCRQRDARRVSGSDLAVSGKA